jgi:hypothetical protein
MSAFIPVPTTFSTIPSYTSQWFLNGFEYSIRNFTTFNLNPGMVRSLTSDLIIRSPAQLSCDISTVGPGGCYPTLPLDIPITYNTVYPVYICWDKTNTVMTENPTLITATGNEFLPSGYNEYSRVSLSYVNGTSGAAVGGVPGTLYPWTQSGSGSDKEWALIVPRIIISGGIATTPTLLTLSDQNKIMPPQNGLKGIFSTRFQAANPGDSLVLSYDGSNLANQSNALQVTPSISGHDGMTFPMICGQDPITNDAAIYYYVSSGATSIQINNIGFLDSMGNRLY